MPDTKKDPTLTASAAPERQLEFTLIRPLAQHRNISVITHLRSAVSG